MTFNLNSVIRGNSVVCDYKTSSFIKNEKGMMICDQIWVQEETSGFTRLIHVCKYNNVFEIIRSEAQYRHSSYKIDFYLMEFR